MTARTPATNFAVIVRLDRTIQYAAACVMISIGRRLLDARRRGHDHGMNDEGRQ
jgi:hypothetical protein